LFYTLYFYVYLHHTSFLISLARKGARARHSEIIRNKIPNSITHLYQYTGHVPSSFISFSGVSQFYFQVKLVTLLLTGEL